MQMVRYEQAFALPGAEGDEIRARLGIIIAGQADGAAVMDVRGIGHVPLLDDVPQGHEALRLCAQDAADGRVPCAVTA
ncbi:hypothetical protein [Candidatus Electronema sp. TJ]|uniref:hypothetical protein n=1 Tax=Candidatus Electronema sp. TJ TaxID=3401573 RepID=UPI003AA92561